MSLNITAKKFELTDAIRAYIEKKINPLFDIVPTITQIDVEVDRRTHHKQGDVFHVRINIQVPHELLHTEEMAQDLYAAIDIAKDEIERQLKKQKNHFVANQRKAKRTRRTLKSFLGWRSIEKGE